MLFQGIEDPKSPASFASDFVALHSPPFRLRPNLTDRYTLIVYHTLVFSVVVYGAALVCGSVVASGVTFFEAENFELCGHKLSVGTPGK